MLTQFRLQIYVRNALMRVIAVVFKRSMSDLAADDRVVFFQQLDSASYQSEQHVCLLHRFIGHFYIDDCGASFYASNDDRICFFESD